MRELVKLAGGWTAEESDAGLELVHLVTGRRLGVPRRVGEISTARFVELMRDWRSQEELAGAFPGTSRERILSMIVALVRSGAVMTSSPTDVLASDDDPLFHRQVEFLKLFEDSERSATEMQARIRGSRVIVLGAGGWGATTMLLLARMGVGEIVVFDPDVVEESNLNRQVLFGVDDIGALKVEAAASRIERDLAGRTRVIAVPSNYRTADDIRPYLTDGLTLLMNPFGYGAPLFESIGNDALVLGVPALHYGSGWVGPLTVPGTGPCLQCLRDQTALSRAIDRTRIGLESQYAAGYGVIAARTAINCSIATWEAFQFLTGCRVPRASQGVLAVDTFDYKQPPFRPVAIREGCVCQTKREPA